MGYTTDFSGRFELNKPLTAEHAEYLTTFSQTRRMKRNAVEAALLEDPVRAKVDLPVGNEGEYFVGGTGSFGQGDDNSVENHNYPPTTQPGLWCQWVPSGDGKGIEWDGSEKFYNYTEWLEYIVQNFLGPWGYKLNGEVNWYGEDPSDVGILVVEDNCVGSRVGRVVYE
jgi:hypothetical protein